MMCKQKKSVTKYVEDEKDLAVLAPECQNRKEPTVGYGRNHYFLVFSSKIFRPRNYLLFFNNKKHVVQ